MAIFAWKSKAKLQKANSKKAYQYNYNTYYSKTTTSRYHNEILLLFLFLFFSIFSQEAVQGTLLHDNLEREYILYIPNSYDGQEPYPLVLNLHGYTSNGGEQMIYSNLFEVADTNFLIVHPTGTLNTINEEFGIPGEIFEVDEHIFE